MRKKVILLFFIFLLLPFFQARADETGLADGHYQINVSLLHAYEDKLSMGNAGLAERGELVKKGEELQLYLKMQTLTVSNLTTSVKRFYLFDKEKKAYVSGSPYQYDISLYDGKVQNPSIFVFRLSDREDNYPVLVDPGVSAMGSDPIKARLHLDWQSLVTVTDEGSSLEAMVIKDQATEASHQSQAAYDDLTVFGLSGGEFTYSTLTRKSLEEEGMSLNPLSQAKGYNLGYWSPIVEIPEDQTTNITSLAKPMTIEKPITLAFRKDNYEEVWQKVDGKFQKLESVVKDNTLEVNVVSLGVFALVKAAQPLETVTSTTTNEVKGTALPTKGSLSTKSVSTGFSKAMARTLPKSKALRTKTTTSSVTKANGTLPKVEKVTREEVQAESAKAIQEKSETSGDVVESAATKAQEPRERYGIIALIASIYVICFLFGLWLWKRVWARLKEEIERAYYVRLLEAKGEEK